MAALSFQVRPDETDHDILRTRKFVDQANIILSHKLLNEEETKAFIIKVTKYIETAKRLQMAKAKQSTKLNNVVLVEKLKLTYQSSVNVLEHRLANTNLRLKVGEFKLKAQKKQNNIEQLQKAVQDIKIGMQLESDKNEERKRKVLEECASLEETKERILMNLEKSGEVGNLRKMEEEKRNMENEVEALRAKKNELFERIATMKASLKAESKKPFSKMVLECAKHYHLYTTLTPKLENSLKNIEKLKAEEAIRKSSGSLDETMLFDNSFVLVSNQPDKNTSMEKRENKEKSGGPPAKKMTVPPKKALEKVVEPASMIGEQTLSQGVVEQNTTVVEQPMEEEQVEQEEEDEPVEQEEEEEIHEQNSQDEPNTPEEEEMAEEVVEEEMEENVGDTSVDMMQDVGNDDEEEEDVQELGVTAPSDPKVGFFDELLSKSPEVAVKGAKVSPADAVLDISMNSNDEAGDLLKDIEGRMDEDVASHGSVNNPNFSFNIFNGVAASDNDSATNFDFNFGDSGSDGNNDNVFDFLGGGGGNGSGDNAGDNAANPDDPFGFGTNGGGDDGGNMSFNFNMNFGSDNDDNGGASGGASFFNM